jgi:exopolysaccharide biosynthesis protein
LLLNRYSGFFGRKVTTNQKIFSAKQNKIRFRLSNRTKFLILRKLSIIFRESRARSKSMKKISVIFRFQLCVIVLFFSAAAQDFRTVRDGIEYAELTREIDKTPVKMNLLRLDLTKVRLDVEHALDSAIGLERTSSIATRHGAFAAINAGFFRLDASIFAGDATGFLIINKKLFSESFGDRIALLIFNGKSDTKVGIENVRVESFLKIGRKTFAVSGINRERKNDELVEYHPEFGRTTLTSPDGAEIVVINGKITKIINGKGSTVIPSNGFVLSASGKMWYELLRYAKIGVKAKVDRIFKQTVECVSGPSYSRGCEPFAVETAEDIIGGVPQLIKDGKIEITWEQEKSSKAFVETRHPRTAVAKLKDGKFLMATVNGRQPGYSVGMNLNELAAFLLELGATDAMNLDGGGSTTMFLGGKIVNRPSDKEGERKVSDAILVFPRNKN